MILVANHSSLLDGVLIHAVTWRPLRVLVAADWANWRPFRPLFVLMGGIEVSRDRKNTAAMDRAAAALGRGEAVALFPEGTIREDGTLGEFRRGAARIALLTGAAVYPCAIIGAFQALPWPKVLPRPRRITVRCGEPLRFEVSSASPPSEEALSRASDRIRAAVQSLTGQGH